MRALRVAEVRTFGWAPRRRIRTDVRGTSIMSFHDDDRAENGQASLDTGSLVETWDRQDTGDSSGEDSGVIAEAPAPKRTRSRKTATVAADAEPETAQDTTIAQPLNGQAAADAPAPKRSRKAVVDVAVSEPTSLVEIASSRSQDPATEPVAETPV